MGMEGHSRRIMLIREHIVGLFRFPFQVRKTSSGVSENLAGAFAALAGPALPDHFAAHELPLLSSLAMLARQAVQAFGLRLTGRSAYSLLIRLLDSTRTVNPSAPPWGPRQPSGEGGSREPGCDPTRICRHDMAANDERGRRKTHLSLCRGGYGANLNLRKGIGGS
jgi:hypothetical protein